MKFHGVPFSTRPANNHASPSGSLPFLLPAQTTGERPASPIPANKIARWVVSNGGREETAVRHEEAYMALIDHTIRNAWLYHLYLDEGNFSAVAWLMYVASVSSHAAVRKTLAYQLRNAAREELLKTRAMIDGDELYAGAREAFHALSTLLGQDRYFFGHETPGLFDASVFAYTQILLDRSLPWKTLTLADALREHANLVQHCDRLAEEYFSS